MTALLLAPHHDDESLFAAQICLRYRPHVIVCTESHIQEGDGITQAQRAAETNAALDVLGCTWHQWPVPDSKVADYVGEMLIWLSAWLPENKGPTPDRVFAPLVEPDGHEHHNIVGKAAVDMFGAEVVTGYATYARGGGRTHTETEVEWEPGWRALKLRAMSCYGSQIDLAATRPWFAQDDMLREWVSP